MERNSTTPVLELVDLVAGYRLRQGLLGSRRDVRAVAGVSLSVNEGETLCLVGESGCGKSTVARTVVNLLRPFSGEVRFEGADITGMGKQDLRAMRQQVQLVFQDPYASLNPRMTVRELLTEAWRIHPGIVERQHWDTEVDSLLERVGLNPAHASRYPHQFSGGQRQRICIARALSVRPRLIVCDEAVSALDVSIQAQILTLLKQLQDDLGVAYLFITHDLGVVRHLADRVAVMQLGTIVETGDTEQIYERPAHPYTQALLSAAPSVDDWREQTSDEILLAGDAPSPLNPPSGCRFHPRCWKAQDICGIDEPALVHRDTDHPVACHFASADAGVGPVFS
ncbi:peptide/nickel transport system ATP-binding protein/oligopeptide transport system ATP-binding protein [Amycolatopsis marina]|uniref:Peptide/nickel transport system ATP-binding protein/oligopeptide transport system ATP-binding protein n=1 Tax=Amycolatopsis marina TaxID=490629 RepID=A0A1I1AAM2_9PSEU|nr:oligopeptide/dipeptide ABC transporter ATP-binding protein [Amycolatopsis marina]SFB33530.1 peptide/nickel transport system ATP-binding protein/oligopeptide transport system ATP-binding protein [Amycolatopsis marina]